MNYLTFKMHEITGTVLAGGRSNRFGQDKSLFVFKGKTLVEYSIEALTPWCGDVMISTNKPQEMLFTGLQTIGDIHRDCGPMGGIHSALVHARGSIILFLGCDMPFLDGRIFPFLVNKLGDNQAVVPTHGGFRETLCMVMRKDCQKQVEEALLNKTFKILDLLLQLETVYVDVSNENFYSPGMFHNINTRADLQFEP